VFSCAEIEDGFIAADKEGIYSSHHDANYVLRSTKFKDVRYLLNAAIIQTEYLGETSYALKKYELKILIYCFYNIIN
jgi:hypothetical protein